MADLDTVTGDFLRTSRGDLLVRTNVAVVQQVWLRLATERGSLLADPDFGSLLHTLPQAKLVAGIEEVATAYARDALQPLLDEGRLVDLELSAVRTARNRLELSLRARSADGTPITFTDFVRI